MAANLDDDFYRHDLHFRTVTSLLSLFGRKDRTPYNMGVAAASRENYELIMAVAYLLARGTEAVACLPKLTPLGITLFCTPDLSKGKNPHPVEAEKGFGDRLQAQSDLTFPGTVRYLLQNWYEKHSRVEINLMTL